MAQNDIIVAKEGAGGSLSEIALAPSDIGAAASAHTHTASDITNFASEAASAAPVQSVSVTFPVVNNGSGSAPNLSVVSASAFTSGVMSAADKTKLDGIAAGAEVNVNADWNASSGDAQILNKPTLGTAATADIGTGAGDVAEGNHTHTQLHDKSHSMTDATSHTAGNHKVFYSDGSGQIQELALGNSGEVLTSNGASAAPSFAAASGGIGGSTGATDGAVLRADGTGGSTAQSSDIVIDDATTSTQANVAIVNAHSETDSALVLTPKGTGAFIVGPKPDGTSTGGNARGVRSVCMVVARNAATQIASGTSSVAIGYRATASNLLSLALCNNTASGAYSTAIGGSGSSATNSASTTVGGLSLSASGAYAFCGGGESNTASDSHAIAFGQLALANRRAIIAHAAGQFSAQGDAQTIRAVLRNKTTTNSAVELFTNGSSTRLTCPSGKVMVMLINITGSKSDGSAVAHYVRQYAIKNVGGTTSEVYAPVTIGTDNAAGTSIALSADDTNDALKIEVTGIASETWRWVASVDAVEVIYGS